LPAYAGVFAFIIFFGKFGTLNLLLMEAGLIKTPINFIYGLHGLVFIQALHMLPFIVLSLAAGFTQIDPSLRGSRRSRGSERLPKIYHRHPASLHTHVFGRRRHRFPVALHRLAHAVDPGQGRFSPSVAYINIAYHFTDVHRKYMGIVAVVVSSVVCISLFLLARWWVENEEIHRSFQGTTSEGRVIEPGPLMKTGAYLYMGLIAFIVLLTPRGAGAFGFFQEMGL
jgi:iron(III) transport system permease protein